MVFGEREELTVFNTVEKVRIVDEGESFKNAGRLAGGLTGPPAPNAEAKANNGCLWSPEDDPREDGEQIKTVVVVATAATAVEKIVLRFICIETEAGDIIDFFVRQCLTVLLGMSEQSQTI